MTALRLAPHAMPPHGQAMPARRVHCDSLAPVVLSCVCAAGQTLNHLAPRELGTRAVTSPAPENSACVRSIQTHVADTTGLAAGAMPSKASAAAESHMLGAYSRMQHTGRGSEH